MPAPDEFSTPAQSHADLTTAVHAALRRNGSTVAVAESLTGGLLGAALSAPAGASQVFHGGVIAYTHAVKAQVLGVDPQVLRTHGAVNAQVAAQMACGVRQLLGTTHGVALTGVAGPDPSDGAAVGTVWLGVSQAERRLATGDGRAGAATSGSAKTIHQGDVPKPACHKGDVPKPADSTGFSANWSATGNFTPSEQCMRNQCRCGLTTVALQLHGTREQVRQAAVFQALHTLAYLAG